MPSLPFNKVVADFVCCPVSHSIPFSLDPDCPAFFSFEFQYIQWFGLTILFSSGHIRFSTVQQFLGISSLYSKLLILIFCAWPHEPSFCQWLHLSCGMNGFMPYWCVFWFLSVFSGSKPSTTEDHDLVCLFTFVYFTFLAPLTHVLCPSFYSLLKAPMGNFEVLLLWNMKLQTKQRMCSKRWMAYGLAATTFGCHFVHLGPRDGACFLPW